MTPSGQSFGHSRTVQLCCCTHLQFTHPFSSFVVSIPHSHDSGHSTIAHFRHTQEQLPSNVISIVPCSQPVGHLLASHLLQTHLVQPFESMKNSELSRQVMGQIGKLQHEVPSLYAPNAQPPAMIKIESKRQKDNHVMKGDWCFNPHQINLPCLCILLFTYLLNVEKNISSADTT